MNYSETITPGHFAMVKRWVTLKSIGGYVKKKIDAKMGTGQLQTQTVEIRGLTMIVKNMLDDPKLIWNTC